MSPRLLAAGYITAINTFSFGIFAYDKHQATTRGWRIPENQLHLTALLGGWVGGITAISILRHKSKKQAFQIPYFTCCAANIAAVGVLMMSSPSSRSKMIAFIKNNQHHAFNALNAAGKKKRNVNKYRKF